MSKYKKHILWIFLFLAFINHVPLLAGEHNEGSELYKATLREWKNASQEDKIFTCVALIYEVILDNHFKLPVKNITEITPYATQLLTAIDFYANSNGNVNNNERVNLVALLSMLQLEWIDENYLKFWANMPKNGRNNLNTYTKRDSTNASTQNETANAKTPKHIKSSQKVKVAPKPKLLSKKAGKEWVKYNVHLRLHFPLDEMTARLGDYETTTIGNIERYYFPRINMTFFVIKSSQEFIGFSESKPSQKK